jgi:hypothetical protein
MSQRDLQQLFVRSLDAADVTDERGVPFQAPHRQLPPPLPLLPSS